MKKILGIIILSFIIFSAGAISGTGGLDTKSTKRNVDSLQTKTIELGYTSVIDIWTAIKHSEVFLKASLENINATINRFREDQLKLAAVGFVNYKNTNRNKSDANLSDNLSVLEDEPNTPTINPNTNFTPNQDVIFIPSQIIDPTIDTSTDVLITNHPVNRNTEVKNKLVE